MANQAWLFLRSPLNRTPGDPERQHSRGGRTGSLWLASSEQACGSNAFWEAGLVVTAPSAVLLGAPPSTFFGGNKCGKQLGLA